MPDNQMPAKVWLRLCGGGVSMPGGRAYQSVVGGSREAARHAAYVRSDIAERMAEALEGLVSTIEDYERVNNLSPPPGKADCWQSVTQAKAALSVWSASWTRPIRR